MRTTTTAPITNKSNEKGNVKNNYGLSQPSFVPNYIRLGTSTVITISCSVTITITTIIIIMAATITITRIVMRIASIVPSK